jgi:hypothetical protein
MLEKKISNFFSNLKKRFFFKSRSRNKKIETILKSKQIGYYFEENSTLVRSYLDFKFVAMAFMVKSTLKFQIKILLVR